VFRDFLHRSLQRRLLVSLLLGVGLSLAVFQIVVDQLVDRYIARSFASPSVNTVERDRLLRAVDLVLLGGVITVLGVSAIVVVIAVRRGLEPLERVGTAAQALSMDRGAQALPLADIPREIRPLCERFNELIERLLEALEHERRLAAGLAHELRTPLAEIRAIGEVAVARANVGELHESLRQMTSAASGLQGMIDSLLAAARADRGAVRQALEPMPVASAVRSRLERLRHADPASSARLVVNVDEDAWVHIEPRLFDVMLLNLLANAFQHGDDGSPVEIQWLDTTAAGTGGVLRVRNHAPHLTREDLRHLVERLPRPQEEDRLAATSGAGLGLWIIGRLCRALDLDLRLDLDEAQRLSVELAGFLTL